MTILIEISIQDRGYGKKWDLRIGDIEGSTNVSNSKKCDILGMISSEMCEEEKRFDEEKITKIEVSK